MWAQIILFVVSIIVQVVMAPKPPSATPPAGLNEFDIPTAELGRAIPVLFGTRDIKGANVVWYGDLGTSKIQKGGGKK